MAPTQTDEYTALLALPNGEMARDAAERLVGADRVSVTDDVRAGVWLSWAVSADSDKEGVEALQEIRLRAEMSAKYLAPHATTPSGDNPSLFQGTPFLILRGGSADIIHCEDIYCV